MASRDQIGRLVKSAPSMARIVRIHHVAFAHGADSTPQRAFADVLGLEVCHAEDVDGFVERMIAVGDGYVQTLEATGQGLIEKFVGKRGNSLHHIAFEVDDLDGYLDDLRLRSVNLIDETARPGGMNTMIAFIHPHEFDGLLVELVMLPEEIA